MTVTDQELAASVARQAADLLLEVRRLRRHLDGRLLGRVGDVASNELILDALRRQRPEDSILSEESRDDLSRLEADRVWIIDPLDGTREFSLEGRSDWAVHVALWERRGDGEGPGLTAAAVALPALGALHQAGELTDQGGAPAPPLLRVVVSDSRPPEWLDQLAERLAVECTPMGSAGAKAMAVLRGEADAYVHAGGQYEWDSAAPVGVVEAAGLHASRLDGSPLRYNQPSPYVPDLVICRKAVAAPLLEALADIGAS